LIYCLLEISYGEGFLHHRGKSITFHLHQKKWW
jgi:hypothetical protein